MLSGRFFGLAALVAVVFAGGCDGPTGPKTGSLTVNINLLPPGASAEVSIAPVEGGAAIQISSSRTVADLAPGFYLVTAANTSHEKSRYVPITPTQTVEVVAGSAAATATIDYRLSTGIIALVVSGAPQGTSPAITVFNLRGFAVNVPGSGEVGFLEPGEYLVQPNEVEADEICRGKADADRVTVTASLTPVQVKVEYAAITGTIQLTSTGVPEGTVPTWDVRGPGTFTAVMSGNGTPSLSRLVPGRYTVVARSFDAGGETWGATVNPAVLDVVAGGKASASFSFATRPPTLNLVVDGAYIVQSSQRYAGTVPLIANREAFLRVFVKANENNVARPVVRATFYRGSEVVSSILMNPTSDAVGTHINEASGTGTWGALLSPTLIQPGISFIVEADATNLVRETNEDDNRFPFSGSAVALNVREVPHALIRFVPINTAANQLTGDVNAGRINDLLSSTLKMFPIGGWTADVRAPFTTSAPVLDPNDNNQSWGRILEELNATRIAEGTAYYYMGIVKTPYTSGVVRMGYVPGKTSLSWDAQQAHTTIVHELGHNFGRRHAPCGGAGGTDPNYPYFGAQIGVFGFDTQTRTVQNSALPDLMSYCRPNWISDYNYEGIMAFRAAAAATEASASLGSGNRVQPALIVWGTVDNGYPKLSPAFMSETKPALPQRAGAYRVEGFDRSGGTVFSIVFDPDSVDDTGRDLRQFAFAVPMTEARAAGIVSLRLSGNGREARLNAGPAAELSTVTAARTPAGVSLSWDAESHPLVVVRDPSTRTILSLARGGRVVIPTALRTLDITVSNRVQSARTVLSVRD